MERRALIGPRGQQDHRTAPGLYGRREGCVGAAATPPPLPCRYGDVSERDAHHSTLGLRRLTVSNNQLGAIPAGIDAMRHLERLAAGDNKITSLPDSLGALAALTYLDVSNNSLTALPRSMSTLSMSLRGGAGACSRQWVLSINCCALPCRAEGGQARGKPFQGPAVAEAGRCRELGRRRQVPAEPSG
jgi:hypothetical protein